VYAELPPSDPNFGGAGVASGQNLTFVRGWPTVIIVYLFLHWHSRLWYNIPMQTKNGFDCRLSQVVDSPNLTNVRKG